MATDRKIAVETLMELCEQQPTRQFLFITPQDMHPFLAHRKRVPNIIKMSVSPRSPTRRPSQWGVMVPM